MPLPADVGDAFSTYLCPARRPATARCKCGHVGSAITTERRIPAASGTDVPGSHLGSGWRRARGPGRGQLLSWWLRIRMNTLDMRKA
jgi:hypothetical protein